jgi:[protein-PII] uridylyltransferase
VQLIHDASETAAVIEVRTGDRAGLLYALGRALSEIKLSIRSAHISTLAGQAIDTFYVIEVDGSAPSSRRAQDAIDALTVAAGIPAAPAATR